MVKQGYKQTEIGIIPKDWEIREINNSFYFLPNNTFSRENMNDSDGLFHNIHYGDVLIKYGAILDCRRTVVPFLNRDISTKNLNIAVLSGDVIMADTAEDNIVGKATEVINVDTQLIVAGLHTLFLRPIENLFATGFLGYYLNSLSYHNQLLPLITGIKVSSVSRNSVKRTYVLRPPIEEQAAIAEALSDIDLLIESTEKLIAKKKDIKQGMMQELLTGKRRLSGFNTKWNNVRVEDVADLCKSTIPANFISTDCYIGTDNMITDKQGIRKNTIPFSSLSVREYKINDILLSNIRPYLKKIWLADRNGGCSNDVLVIRSKDIAQWSPAFLFAILSQDTFFALVTDTAVGTKMPRGDKTVIKAYEFHIPSDLKEQTAIAKMISDMDKDIEKLAITLAKYRQIKQGMMSELLTGRIRLPFQIATPKNVHTSVDESKRTAGSVPKGISISVTTPASSGHDEQLGDVIPWTMEQKHHSEGYNDAVILVGLVHSFGSEEYPFTAFDCQKFPYLFHRYLEGAAKGYEKFAAGPYNPALRYKTARPIALKKGYIREHIGKYKGFILDKNAGEALAYFADWFGNEPLKWLEQFRYLPKRKDKLELLTTVDKAMVELRTAGDSISVSTVKKVIQKSKEWKAKLNRALFSDENIDMAIAWSRKLFGEED